MFTVIFLSRATQPSLERWRDLFSPFEEQGDLAFCSWNASSSPRTLHDAVPDLAAAIKGKREWRAIIIGTTEDDTAPRRIRVDFNPFDFAARHAHRPGEHVDSGGHSSHAVVRLTHMLLGIPELGPKGFVPDPSYEDPQSHARIYLSEFRATHPDLTDEESLAQFNANLMLGNNRQTRYRVVHPSPDEQAAHMALSQNYDLDQIPPIEVLLIATRITSRSTPGDLLELMWNSSGEREMSRFAERNNFPASSRFLVFDLKPPGHSEYELNELLFAISILTLSINDLPPSGLQAERLYEIELDIDKRSLAVLLNDHLGQLVRVREYIQKRLKDQRPRSGVALREVLPRINLTVDFERLTGEGLSVPTTGYSLAADRSGDDDHRWQASVGIVSAEAKRFMREPARALEQTVSEARIREAALTREEAPLSDIDIAELEVELATRSDGLVRKASGISVTPAQLEEIIKEHNGTVSGAIHERMRSRSIFMASAVVLGAWALALVPYLMAAFFDGGVNFLESLLLTLVVLGVVTSAGLITLEVMRRRLIALIRHFNRDLRDFVAKVAHGASEYSEFLSDLVTYASGRRRLLAEQHRIKQRNNEKIQLYKLLHRIEERIETEKSLVRSLDHPLQIEQRGHVAADLEQYGASRAARILLWPAGRTMCEFNQSGDKVKAPYSFVTRLAVSDLALDEPAELSEATPDAEHSSSPPPEEPNPSSHSAEGLS